MDVLSLIKEYKNCECGLKHESSLKDVQVGSGYVHRVGEILKKNGFPKKLLLVADKTTLAVSDGILQSLSDFDLTLKIYDDLRVATMDDARLIERLIDQGAEGVISVGTGSLNDPCRLACFKKSVPFCIFATAPSMDGFASDTAPIVENNFKISCSAKSPEVIIADTKILAESPAALKSAGFGDMMAKYVALIDWKVSHIVSGEHCCERVYDLTRFAVDRALSMADKVTATDEAAAAAVFEGLLLTGIAMGFVKTSRPGSGTEHIMSHYVECKQLLDGMTPNFHGEDVGVFTLIMLKFYNSLLSLDKITCHIEKPDWREIYGVYGVFADDVRRLNTPDTITDGISPRVLEERWEDIKAVVRSVPLYGEVLEKMKTAGCKITYEDIGKPRALIEECFKYHPFMRRRLSLKRLSHMMNEAADLPLPF